MNVNMFRDIDILNLNISRSLLSLNAISTKLNEIVQQESLSNGSLEPRATRGS